MKMRRESAATVKKTEPRKKVCTTMIEKNGCRYQESGAWCRMRVWSAQGAKVPSQVPAIMPVKVKRVVTKEPAQRPPEIAELGDGFGKEKLEGVSLEVAEDRCAEDGGDDDGAEPDGADIVVGVRVGAVEEDFAAVTAADRAEVFGCDAEEREREPEQEVNVGGDALDAELELEGEELPKHGHSGVLSGWWCFGG